MADEDDELAGMSEAEIAEYFAFRDWLDNPDADPQAFIELPDVGWVSYDRVVLLSHDEMAKRAQPTKPARKRAEPRPVGDRKHVSPAELAAYLGVDRKTIDRRLDAMTEGVHYYRIGRRVVMNVSAATAFFAGESSRATATEFSLLDGFTAKARGPK